MGVNGSVGGDGEGVGGETIEAVLCELASLLGAGCGGGACGGSG